MYLLLNVNHLMILYILLFCKLQYEFEEGAMKKNRNTKLGCCHQPGSGPVYCNKYGSNSVKLKYQSKV